MLILPFLLLQTSAHLSLDLSKPGVAVSPNLYGLMTEEINYSYDGGLYGELVRNRAFMNRSQGPEYWKAVGTGSEIALEQGGINRSRPVSLRVKGGVANEGYWGIPVRPNTSYRLEVWAKADTPGPIQASIESTSGATVYAQSTLKGLNGTWQKLTTTLKTTNSPTTKDAHLVLRAGDARTVWLGQVSLFPPTFNRRPNGNRPDLMQLLVDMKPRFLRFPGGNYLEGNTIADRFPWKETLGPIEERPGHRSPWGYRSTDGMGLLEYLYWCEDMKAKPVLAVFAGYALNGQAVKAGPELDRYVKEALDEIEYVIGGLDTTWGARRAQDGHPKPFPLEYVEVGNEDGFDRSGSYEARFVQFYDAIKAKYPKLKVISTTGGKDWLGVKFPINQRKPDAYDEHYYSSTWEMMSMATKYDDYDRKGPKIFVGEWAAQDVPEPWKDIYSKGPTPNMNCAIADAAFLTGLERNSDIVVMSCYAPLLVNVNPGGRQWAVNLIGYDALTSFGSPSYHAQKMFMANIGNRTVPLALTGSPTQSQGDKTLPGLFGSATRDSKTLYLKIVNALPTPQEVSIDLKGANVGSTGTLVTLTGDLKGMNTITEPTKFVPVTTEISGLGASFKRTLPAYSVNVLKLRIN